MAGTASLDNLPSRTPSPSIHIHQSSVDLDDRAHFGASVSISNWNDVDGLLSPTSTSFNNNNNNNNLLTPDAGRLFPRAPRAMASEATTTIEEDAPTASPFNFQTQYIATSPVKSNIGQRRGHRYKHSSISTQHQVFQEPPSRPPPVLPASLPVPTLREAWFSMHRDQRARLYWCICHLLIAAYVFLSASGSLAMTALSHLVFFDVGSAAICVAVDVLGNFEVWRRSSIRHPFGLQRAEVLAGFAMSVFLVFGGFDLLSHNLKHLLEGMGSHAPHHPHEHLHMAEVIGDGHVAAAGLGSPLGAEASGSAHSGHGDLARTISPGTVDVASLAAVISTLVSAYGLKNHARVRRVMRVSYPTYLSSLLPDILANPFHFLTLSFSFLLLLLPLLSVTSFVWLDRTICASIAVSMFFLGTRLAVAQGFMLLMSYNGRAGQTAASADDSAVKDVLQEIESEPAVVRVDEAQFWQVHYGLCMANLKVGVLRGVDDVSLSQLRGRIGRIIQNRLGEEYGKGGVLKWEVTIETSTDGG